MLCDPIKAENDKKDLLIVKLKAEVFEMRQKDRDYKLLHEHYIQLQHKFARVQDEKVGKYSMLTNFRNDHKTACR